MANVVAFNAKEAGDVLYWRPLGTDTAVIYKYTCPVDSHKVASAVQLASLKCPIHDTTLANETAVTL